MFCKRASVFKKSEGIARPKRGAFALKDFCKMVDPFE